MSQKKNLPYKRYVLFLLTGVSTFAYLDRQLISILQEAIKVDLGLSDTQLGFVAGLAFTIPYVIFGVPIAYLSDRYNRKNILTAALILWSGVTALTGRAMNLMQLVGARLLVGLGEAGSSPIAYSLIPDYFPAHQRARAFSIYGMGTYIGILISFLFGGYILEHYGWRMTFSLLGIPGVLFSLLLFFTLKEPIRGGLDNLKTKIKAPSLGDTFGLLYRQNVFWWLILAAGVHILVGIAFSTWAASFFVRVHQMSYTAIGTWLALVIGICGSAGTYLGGYLADKYGTKNRLWYLWIPAIGVMVSLPFSCIFLLASNKVIMLIAHCLSTLSFALYLGPCLKIIQDLVPPNMRGTTSSIFVIGLNLFGSGIGPLLAGGISDWLTPIYGNYAIRWALMMVIGLKVVSFLFFLKAIRALKKVDF